MRDIDDLQNAKNHGKAGRQQEQQAAIGYAVYNGNRKHDRACRLILCSEVAPRQK